MSRFFRAALSQEPVPVSIGRYRFSVPAVPASTWILALTDDSDSGILPGMLSERDEDRFWRLLETERVATRDVVRAVKDLIGVVSGVKWWEALKLIYMAEHNDGEFYGRLLLRGVRPEDMSLSAWCSAATALALEGQDDKTRLQFTTRLKAPPPGIDNDEEVDEGMSFESMVKSAQSIPGMSVGG